MKAILQGSEFSNRHDFTIEIDKDTYSVSIWLNEKGKFIDETIKLNDIELEMEGEEGEIRENITDYLADNWEKLV